MRKDELGKEVLDVYLKESPSAITIEDKKEFDKFCLGQKRLWQERLKIPLRIFKDALVLDYGCGTGETDIFLGLHGAEVEGIDFNPKSIERAEKLAEHFSLSEKLDFTIADVQNYAYTSDKMADFAVCLGVLPHVSEPEKVFTNMLDRCKYGGFIVLGFIEELGIIQRLLHRSIVRAIAGFDEDTIIKIARRFFPDHLSRSIEYGQRTERSVIFDYLVNRHMYGLPLEKVLNWFNQNKISYYSSWPSIDMPFQINPYPAKLLPISHPILKEFRALLRLRWLFTQKEDVPVFSEVAEVLNSNFFFQSIDAFSSILTDLVQNQDGVWTKKDLAIAQKLSKKIICEFDNIFEKLQKSFRNELDKKIGALNNVLTNIAKLQQKEAEDFDRAIDLFKELNGLGTFYLVGINNGSDEVGR